MQTMLKGAAHLQVGLGAAVCQDHLQPCLCSNVRASMQAPKAAHAGQPRALAPLPVRHTARWVTRAEGESGKVEKKGDDKGSKKVQKVKL